VATRGPLLPEEQRAIAVFEEARASVVFITTLVSRTDFFTLKVTEVPQGTGSGFVWDDAGHIVTNFHVIYEAQDVQVTLADRSIFKAELVGTAPDKDLAVLKIRAPKDKLPPIRIGTSSDLKVGQSVYAIGNPFGLDQTLTTGIISALGREIESLTRRPIQGVIQTDAAINPGNSGGPLLDSAGRSIGVNTAIYSPSGASAGVGFAVPIDTVNRIVPQLIAFGKVIQPGLGIQVVEDSVARQVGIDEGVLILDVDRQGAAAKAGMMPTRYDRDRNVVLGDIIISIDGQSIKTSNDLYKILERYNVGDEVRVEVIRAGRKRTLTVRLQEV
jgi:S1-C subfamily serine protease